MKEHSGRPLVVAHTSRVLNVEPPAHPSNGHDPPAGTHRSDPAGLEALIDVKSAARFLGVSPSLVYAYVERKQMPHYRLMGRAVRFRLSELDRWRHQFHVNGGNE